MEPTSTPTPDPNATPSAQPPVNPAQAADTAALADSATPAAASPSPVSIAAPAAPAEPEKVSNRVLLVEDDDSLASVYTSRLQSEGFEVRRVANGEEALAAALSFKPSLAVLDVMMPRVSGFDVLDIMRNTPETANLKVIMLTALSQDSDKERAQALGVDDYLVKSQVVISDVVERIRMILGSQKQ